MPQNDLNKGSYAFPREELKEPVPGEYIKLRMNPDSGYSRAVPSDHREDI